MQLILLIFKLLGFINNNASKKKAFYIDDKWTIELPANWDTTSKEIELEVGSDNLPIIEDFVDIVNAGEDLAHKDWSTGKNCVNSESNPRWNSEFKYYNEWIRRQRISEQMQGPSSNSENPVTSFKHNYEKEHPLDNSPAGYLARISGLTKQTAENILSIIAYFDYLHQYKPQTVTAFLNQKTNSQKSYHFKSIFPSIFPPLLSNLKFSTYENLRYRNLIV